MKSARFLSIPSALIIAVSVLALNGCRGRDERFVPSEEAAQHALEIALGAWQNGKSPPIFLREESPAIHLVDTQYQPGQKLVASRILGPTTGDAHRCYAVRLTLDNPRQEVRARFVVLGLDPLYVMRYEDFELIAHWDRCEKPSSSEQPQ